jgi:hypothetical protein
MSVGQISTAIFGEVGDLRRAQNFERDPRRGRRPAPSAEPRGRRPALGAARSETCTERGPSAARLLLAEQAFEAAADALLE